MRILAGALLALSLVGATWANNESLGVLQQVLKEGQFPPWTTDYTDFGFRMRNTEKADSGRTYPLPVNAAIGKPYRASVTVLVTAREQPGYATGAGLLFQYHDGSDFRLALIDATGRLSLVRKMPNKTIAEGHYQASQPGAPAVLTLIEHAPDRTEFLINGRRIAESRGPIAGTVGIVAVGIGTFEFRDFRLETTSPSTTSTDVPGQNLSNLGPLASVVLRPPSTSHWIRDFVGSTFRVRNDSYASDTYAIMIPQSELKQPLPRSITAVVTMSAKSDTRPLSAAGLIFDYIDDNHYKLFVARSDGTAAVIIADGGAPTEVGLDGELDPSKPNSLTFRQTAYQTAFELNGKGVTTWKGALTGGVGFVARGIGSFELKEFRVAVVDPGSQILGPLAGLRLSARTIPGA
jgi:hypothetical protein